MKIISPYKDYYDWVAGKYGGGDPRVTYVRGVIPCPEGREVTKTYTGGSNFDCVALKDNEAIFMPRSSEQYAFTTAERSGYQYQVLLIAGRAYHVRRSFKMYPWHDKRETEYGRWTLTDLYGERRHSILPVVLSGEANQRIEKLHRLFKAPVLLCDSYRVALKVPQLIDYDGIAAELDAQRIYQEIAMCLGSINDHPDDIPPGKQTDVEKAVSHGFDKKKSFRHRK